MNRLFSATLAALLMLTLVACGGRTGAEPTAVPTTPPPTETPVPDPTATPLPAPATVLEIAASAGNFQALLDAITAADLTEKLSSDGPYTVLAPTDFAFSEVDPTILENPEALADTLMYHIIEGDLSAAALGEAQSATSLLGDSLTFTTEDDQILVNGAPIAIADIEADNGVIHVLQEVLLPPSLAAMAPAEADAESASVGEAAAGAVAAASAAVAGAAEAAQSAAEETVANADADVEAVADRAAGAVEAIQNAAAGAADAAKAVLADADVDAEAVADRAAGAVEAVQNAAAGAADAAETALADADVDAEAVADRAADAVEAVQNAAAGAADAAETVLANADVDAEAVADRAAGAVETVQDAAAGAAAQATNLADVARAGGQAVTMMASVEAAGLVEILRASGPYTVFAPVDGAFTALPESVIRALISEPGSALKGVLAYHVVMGAYNPEELQALDGGSLETLNGVPLAVTIDEDGTIQVDQSAVIGGPIEAGNGFLYLIDSVLVPVIEE